MAKFLLGFVLGFLACVWAYEIDLDDAVEALWEETWDAIED
ncbi:conserved protein [Tepidicaulis marinus]|uniref:Conserved protein n=1 Tax=Tepidicaulis marinus TaxID=1333998 RepID=A0A081B7C5_9HYPH|nr:hypothetical protein [Tepidicaulis marinus]GAK43943.1 conserved protein [Tepidicaulis marinus]